MGMDLITAGIFAKTGTVLDFDKAFDLVATLNDDEISSFWEHSTGDPFDPDADDRDEILDFVSGMIRDLKSAVSEGRSRDLQVYRTPDGYTLYILGGSSWGDSPSEGFDALDRLYQIPRLLRAAGFHLPE